MKDKSIIGVLKMWLGQVNWFFMSETQRFLLLSIFIGLFGGLLVVCFHITMDFLSWLTVGTPAGQNLLATLLSPALGAGVAAFLVLSVFRAASGSGVNHTKAALYVSDGYVPFSTVVGKFLACSISIGTGNSLGPEDPALQMGAGVASLLGRLFRLSREHMRLIAPIGAAAGLAAAFNTPITAVLFVIEEVVAAWNAGVLGSILLSAVSAVVVVRWFLGDAPLFRVPEFQLAHPSELLVYALMGLVGGLLSAAFVKSVFNLRKRLAKLPAWTAYVQPLASGLLVGLIGIWLPQAMGAGYDSVDSALHDQFSWKLLLLLGLVKMIATTSCFSTGTPGGMFAPTLFIGAMIGGGMGALAHQYWPFPTGGSSAYVLVGMGTFFAGVFRAPMTSIFMVFEVSASYVIILPVMIANTFAYLVSRQLQRRPFFDLIARMEGLDLPSIEEQRERRIFVVEDAMQPASVAILRPQTLVIKAYEECCKSGKDFCAASKGRGAWAWIHREDLRAAMQEGNGESPMDKALQLKVVPRLYPDMPLDVALRFLGPNPVLPVLSRANPQLILGTLTLEDIHRVFGIRETTAGLNEE